MADRKPTSRSKGPAKFCDEVVLLAGGNPQIAKGDGFDEARTADWIGQAAALPGWVP